MRFEDLSGMEITDIRQLAYEAYGDRDLAHKTAMKALEARLINQALHGK